MCRPEEGLSNAPALSGILTVWRGIGAVRANHRPAQDCFGVLRNAGWGEVNHFVLAPYVERSVFAVAGFSVHHVSCDDGGRHSFCFESGGGALADQKNATVPMCGNVRRLSRRVTGSICKSRYANPGRIADSFLYRGFDASLGGTRELLCFLRYGYVSIYGRGGFFG